MLCKASTMATARTDHRDFHEAWLPPEALRPIGSRRVLVHSEGVLTVEEEVARACDRFGGLLLTSRAAPCAGRTATVQAAPDLVFAIVPEGPSPEGSLPDVVGRTFPDAARSVGDLGEEGFAVTRRHGVTLVVAKEPAGLLLGFFHIVRLGEEAFGPDRPFEPHLPATRWRMVDHWDNVDVDPVMGQVERGYSGGSLFWEAGALRRDLTRVGAYGRLLAACGVNAMSVNNVNVHTTEAHLLTDRLDDVAAIADAVRPYGVRVLLSVSFASPIVLGGLASADPLDEAVRLWWAEATRHVYETIPDFGGYVVKADSEGQPGPFAYGRTHADGANLLADVLEPFGGVVFWRAFVYNHRQDWRDRSTDRARAAFDHFAPLDGQFRDNAILQVKHGPIDFQVREPVSAVIAAMPRTRLAVELQVTQEYTGHQKHVCYLPAMWSEILGFRLRGPDGATVAELAASRSGGLVGVSNAGDDPFWTGHPLAQANLYAFGRLAWDPGLDPVRVLDEWIGLTFAPATPLVRRTLHAVMDDSWRTYELYTAPLGVGFMVTPGTHYGPSVDGYEYSQWGTYHFADRDGIGPDRTAATGTGYTGQYPQPWRDIYESLDRCPDELLLFFHHVPYDHVLHSGTTVVQHIYDTHFAGVERVAGMVREWGSLKGSGGVGDALYERVRELLDEQLRCATQWRDQVNTYFLRKSGVPDARGRRIH
jgi:alpha-glucuronidase